MYNTYMKQVRKILKSCGDFFNSKWGGVVALVAAIGAFLALTLTRLTTASIWFDEAYSAYLTRYNLLLAKGLDKFIWQQCGGVSVAERSIGRHCAGLNLLLD